MARISAAFRTKPFPTTSPQCYHYSNLISSSNFILRERISDTNLIGGWVGARACLNIVGKKRYLCPWREFNPGCPVTKTKQSISSRTEAWIQGEVRRCLQLGIDLRTATWSCAVRSCLRFTSIERDSYVCRKSCLRCRVIAKVNETSKKVLLTSGDVPVLSLFKRRKLSCSCSVLA
jgi:hypothetical protein